MFSMIPLILSEPIVLLGLGALTFASIGATIFFAIYNPSKVQPVDTDSDN